MMIEFSFQVCNRVTLVLFGLTVVGSIPRCTALASALQQQWTWRRFCWTDSQGNSCRRDPPIPQLHNLRRLWTSLAGASPSLLPDPDSEHQGPASNEQ